MSKTTRIGPATIIRAREFLESKPHAVTAAMVIMHLKNSARVTREALQILIEKGEVVRERGAGADGNHVVLYHPAGTKLIVPPDVAFTHREPLLPKRRIGLGPKRISGDAENVGMSRHWLDEALFGKAGKGGAA